MNITRDYIVDSNDKIPSEHKLATQYSVHRNTVSVALKELRAAGLVYPIPGKGWFPNHDVIAHRSLANCSFNQEENRRKYKVIKHEIRTANHVHQQFNCRKTRRIGYFERHDVNGKNEVIRIECKYYNMAIFDEIDNSIIEGSLRKYLHQIGVKTQLSNMKFFVCAATDEIAATLNLPPGAPILCTLEKVNDNFGNTILYGIDYFKQSEVEVNFNHFI